MRRKIFMLGAALLLSGCASSSIDYIDDKVGESLSNTDVVVGDNTAKLDDFRDKKWNEIIELDNGVRVKIDAEVDCKIDGEKASVYTLEERNSISEAEKEAIIKLLFDEGKIYKYGIGYKTLDELQREIDEYNERLENLEAHPEQISAGHFDEVYQGIVADRDEIIDQLENAKSGYEPANDFSGNAYIGYSGDRLFEIYFSFKDDAGDKRNDGTSIKNGLCFTWHYDPDYEGESFINPPELTKSEMLAVAEEVLKAVNIKDAYNLYMRGSGWNREIGFKQGVLDYNKSEIDNIINIQVDFQKRIDYVYMNGLCNVSEEDKDVVLLSFDKIQGIARKELTDNTSKYITDYYDDTIIFRVLELSYLSLKDAKTNLTYQVPCWKFGGYNGALNPMYINAISGEIYSEKELL